jgi:hypothetical protein
MQMPTGRRRRNTQVVVAVIGTAGVLGAALIAVLPTLLGSRPDSSPPAVENQTTGEPDKPPVSASTEPPAVQNPTAGEPNKLPAAASTDAGLESAKKQAEQMAREWLVAFVQHDVDTLVRLSKPPVFLRTKILTSPSEIRAWYTEFVDNLGFPPGRVRFTEVGVGTLDEYRALGYISAGDRLLLEMPLRGNDLYVPVRLQSSTRTDGEDADGLGLYFRRVNDRVEFAGFWT